MAKEQHEIDALYLEIINHRGFYNDWYYRLSVKAREGAWPRKLPRFQIFYLVKEHLGVDVRSNGFSSANRSSLKGKLLEYYQETWEFFLDNQEPSEPTSKVLEPTLEVGMTVQMTGLGEDHPLRDHIGTVVEIADFTSSAYKGLKNVLSRIEGAGIPKTFWLVSHKLTIVPHPETPKTTIDCSDAIYGNINNPCAEVEISTPTQCSLQPQEETTMNPATPAPAAPVYVPTIETVVEVNGSKVNATSESALISAITSCDTATEYYEKVGDSKFAEKKLKEIASTRKKLVAQLDKLS